MQKCSHNATWQRVTAAKLQRGDPIGVEEDELREFKLMKSAQFDLEPDGGRQAVWKTLRGGANTNGLICFVGVSNEGQSKGVSRGNC